LRTKKISDKELDEAWNAMLLNISEKTIKFIIELKKKYKIFVFSNTNEIHINEFYKILEKDVNMKSDAFLELFHGVFYSHKFGYRKPNKEAFEELLKKHTLNARETLFIDDSIQHVKGAESANIHAVHFQSTLEKLPDEFPEWIKGINKQISFSNNKNSLFVKKKPEIIKKPEEPTKQYQFK